MRHAGLMAVTHSHLDRKAASRALIELVADVAWAERRHSGPAQLQRARDEAMTLLPKVDRGDAEAWQRAVELIRATENARARTRARTRT